MNVNVITLIVFIIAVVILVWGLIAIWIQLKEQKEISKAQFISSIFRDFNTHNEIFEKLNPFNQRDQALGLSYKSKIVSFLSFYESIYYLLQKRIITFELINSSFGYSFFSLVHNEYVQESELIPYMRYYTSIFKLHKKWELYRLAKEFEIIGYKNSLAKLENYERACNGEFD
jgi:hypothetical protein